MSGLLWVGGHCSLVKSVRHSWTVAKDTIHYSLGKIVCLSWTVVGDSVA